ncbi:MAG: L,D-transpeptidase [Devosia nanyangense]|uniref:L,D-transpeptidase n=1 Tax=Devosia nanyangense TaxID=1228055 RepID=A0A933KYN3_9HYPH|nr:L,D-transpeptidase [Devosia nanyangense]
MNRLKIVLVALLAALISVSAATPTMAKLYYNPDTNQWEERVISPRGHGSYKPIPRTTVPYDGKFKPGTIIVETSERRLYFVLPGGEAIKYGIGVGRDGFRWAGQHKISRKAEWPGWTPPAEMRKRVPDLPAYMPGGPDNPLGARALYIGATLYRLHGTSEPWTIGQAVSSGCIRLTNEDIIDLYERAKVGSLVVVHQ